MKINGVTCSNVQFTAEMGDTVAAILRRQTEKQRSMHEEEGGWAGGW